MKPCSILAIFLTLTSCTGSEEEKNFPSPPGYDFSKPNKMLMNEDLDEISGIRFDAASSQIIALNDEEGKLYRLDMKGKKQGKAFRFAKKGDFEDLDFDGTYWYAVKSSGEVHRIGNAFGDSADTRVFPFTEPGVEFETICYDPAAKQVFILTKTPKALVEGKVAAYTLDTASANFRFAPQYSPDSAGIVRFSGKEKTFLKPTSAAFHPLTGELYILSVNDRYLLTMKNGEVTGLHKMDKKLFRQAEGICFAPNGDLYISNEAQDAEGNILHFPYKPATAVTPQ